MLKILKKDYNFWEMKRERYQHINNMFKKILFFEGCLTIFMEEPPQFGSTQQPIH